ncbi:MAG: murein biosynthesis integral membrane protein MurJ, partial [Sphingomonadaceae bacterium]
MSLIKNVGTIGGLTLVSRIFGFVRDMLLARVLGAGLAADAWQLAFTLPNTFRRLFAEGAFSVAFVPMYTRRLHDGDEGDREEEADQFASDVLSVFVWVLLGFSAICMIAMPGIVWLLAREYQTIPGKFELSVMLSRVTFPYLLLISLVAMLSGVLNARSRFAPGAIVPVLLNIFMISGILIGRYLRGDEGSDIIVAWALAISVTLSGVAQLLYMWWASRKAGVRLKIHMPRFTPEVKRLGMLILPATFGAGIYQISQLVDTFFATSLPQGSLSLLKYADRLNQMPLGVFGIALGTAILPMLARHIQTGDSREAQRLQSNAIDIAMLLCLPCAVALSICAEAFTTGIFQGGKMTLEDTALMGQIVIALVAGLPANVLIKVFQPAFFSREDTRTPVFVAAGALVIN